MAKRIPRSQALPMLLILFLFLALFMGGIRILGYINEKNETLYSSESKKNDVVYTDIVSINPESATIDSRYAATSKSYKGFFCSCETIDGKMIEAYISTGNFDRYIQKAEYSWSSFMPKKVEFDTPLRIHGRVSSRKTILSASNDERLLFNIYKSDRTTD